MIDDFVLFLLCLCLSCMLCRMLSAVWRAHALYIHVKELPRLLLIIADTYISRKSLHTWNNP